MPFDGAALRAVTVSLQPLLEWKVDKIHQPDRDTVVLVLRGREGNARLLLCANAQNARAQLTQTKAENPAAAPMFCMLLRKHLGGSKLIAAAQQGLERVLELRFATHNEMGDPCERVLSLEVMGRHSNLVFFDDQQRILDSLRHVDFTTSSVRQVLPGLFYERPPAQNKQNPMTATRDSLLELMKSQENKRADKYLLDRFEGLSPLLCREICFDALKNCDVSMDQLTDEGRERLCYFCARAFDRIGAGDFAPTLLCDAASGVPKDFCCLPVRQYGTSVVSKPYETIGALMDDFYARSELALRIRRKGEDLLKLLANATERAARKLSAQTQELVQTADREELRHRGDLLMAQLWQVPTGVSEVTLPDILQAGEPITIELDEHLSPAQNAQKYYKAYARAKAKAVHLDEQILLGKQTIYYLESVLDALERATSEQELNEIRAELTSAGIRVVGKGSGQKGAKAPKKNPPLSFLSSDGMEIYVGRNNTQNDELTLRCARKDDLWLHVQKIPGSHVIVACAGRPVSDQTLLEAAILAARNSKAHSSSHVPVDYTAVKNVKKPVGAKPGMVIYDRFRTVTVDPDAGVAERLAKRSESERR